MPQMRNIIFGQATAGQSAGGFQTGLHRAEYARRRAGHPRRVPPDRIAPANRFERAGTGWQQGRAVYGFNHPQCPA